MEIRAPEKLDLEVDQGKKINLHKKSIWYDQELPPISA
jgi:hypothetical protein